MNAVEQPPNLVQSNLVETRNISETTSTSENGAAGNSLDDTQSQMERSLQRSVTLVFWYKPQCEPLRLHHIVSTFPYFQLSTLTTLQSELDLSSNSYVDSYNSQTGYWEQHLPATVRIVQKGQRLLYRMRKSLLEGLIEDDCPGLREELEIQPTPRHVSSQASSTTAGSLKRTAPDTPDPVVHTSKYYITDGSRTQQPGFALPTNHSYPQSLSVPNETPQSVNPTASPSTSSAPLPLIPSPLGPQYSSATSPNANTFPALPAHLAALHNPPSPIPYHTHPPFKRWPNDYTVSEIAAGFRLMDALIARTPTMKNPTAFELVFGSRYVKSTVCRHRALWRKAAPEIIDKFVVMGSVETAFWGEFVRQVERPLGKTFRGQRQLIEQHQPRGDLLHESQIVSGGGQSRAEGEEVVVAGDTVIISLDL